MLAESDVATFPRALSVTRAGLDALSVVFAADLLSTTSQPITVARSGNAEVQHSRRLACRGRAANRRDSIPMFRTLGSFMAVLRRRSRGRQSRARNVLKGKEKAIIAVSADEAG
jgi:hypothetical protein